MSILPFTKILADYAHFADKNKSFIYVVSFFGVIAAFFEVAFPALLGVGAGILFNDPSGTSYLAYFDFSKNNGFNPVLIFSLFLTVFSIFRYFFILIFFKKKYAFAMQYGYSIAEKTEHSILDLDLLSRRKSLNPDLSRIIHSETNTITWKFFVPIVDLFHELFVIFFSLSALAFINFNLFIFCLPMVLSAFVYFYFSLNSFDKLQDDDDVSFREKLASYAEIIHDGALDTVSQANKFWLKDKITETFGDIKNIQRNNILSSLKPRPRIETFILILLGFVIATLYVLEVNFSSNYLVGVLILLRMLMSLGKFYGSILALKLGSSNAKNVLKNLLPALTFKESEDTHSKNVNPSRFIFKNDLTNKNKYSIAFEELIIGWDKNNKIHINDISVTNGELLLIRGASGSGKTTLLRTVSNSLEPLAGRVVFNNFNELAHEDEIFYIRQDPHIIPSSILENLILDDVDNFLLSNKMTKDDLDKKAKNLLSDFGFSTNRIDSLIKSKNINKTISGGEAQRIAILRLFFSTNVKLCLFDEPTASLDKKNIFLVSNLINKLSQEKICLVITHDDYLSKLIAESNKKYLELK